LSVSFALLQMATFCGHSFIPAALGRDSVVVDLGGNYGVFSRLMREYFHCRCVVVEPTPNLAERLRKIPGLEVFQAAISNHDGVVKFYIAADSQASSISGALAPAATSVVEVPSIRFERLLAEAKVTHIDLLKVDIEGAEIALFDDLSDAILSHINQISIEFHDFCDLVTLEQINFVRRRILAAGFKEIRIEPGHMNSLYVHPRTPGAHLLRRLYIKWLMAPLRRCWHVVRSPFGVQPEGLKPST